MYFMLNAVRSENNVARSKQAEQSSDYFEHVASRGVDDCLQTNLESNCCAHTLNGFQKAWWRVDLGELVTINRIKIYYRDNNQERLAGYQLYVSNTTTSPRDGVLCYEDTSSIRSAVKLVATHQCPYIGQYVTMYNYRNNTPRYSWYSDEAFLELCEVQVFGCQVGRYGEGNCNDQCPGNCYGGNCDSTTGACFYCITDKYGNTCDQDCPASCKDMLCEQPIGNCIDCIPRRYGIRCEHDCSTNCQDRLCDKDSGNCYVCIPGKYGNTCDQNCPENCKDCEKKTGNCIECLTGRYGVTCSSTCPVTCKDFVCNQQTGQCLDCYPGKYGVVCGADCPDTCTDNICSKDDGQCLTTADSKLIIIIVLAAVCGLLLVVVIASSIYKLRKRQIKKISSNTSTEQSVPDTGYTSLDHDQDETPHVYEMVVN
ncbi:platelet endothelial aggregation receptor 1-like [Pecten maximus]|uniref:platelet endothelial aggregation receptor 1-like n=1 Tax=Pecten maximus TaxID=6579 RepID=UPI001458169C|nr:platelet endothelial aggregation receptor 1-like [Pecten maximus]